MRTVEVELVGSDLQKEHWIFWFDDRTCILRLSCYRILERPSKRHKFRVTAKYDEENHQRSDMTRNEVPLPETIAEQAKDIFVRRIRVSK